MIATDEQSSWGPLDLGAGLAPGESGFTLAWGFHTRLIMNEEARSPEQLLRSIAEGMTTAQNFDSPSGRRPGEENVAEGGKSWGKEIGRRSVFVVMSQGHRAILDRAGWNRGQVQSFLAENAVRRIGDLRRAGYGGSPFFEPHQSDDELVSLVSGPDKIIPVAAGGEGGATVCFPSSLRLTQRIAI